MAKRIYYRSMGQTMGPVSGTQLRQQAVKGIVMPDTMVRIGDDGEWVRASRLTDLFDAEGKAIGPKSTDSTPGDAEPRTETMSSQTQTKTMLILAGCAVFVLCLIWYLFFVL